MKYNIYSYILLAILNINSCYGLNDPMTAKDGLTCAAYGLGEVCPKLAEKKGLRIGLSEPDTECTKLEAKCLYTASCGCILASVGIAVLKGPFIASCCILSCAKTTSGYAKGLNKAAERIEADRARRIREEFAQNRQAPQNPDLH